MGISFPENWIWWLGLPVSLGAIFLIYQRVAVITESWFTPSQYSRSNPLLKACLRAIGWVFLFFALIGPYWGFEEMDKSLMGRQIYFLMDVSASMNVRDIDGVSRLDKAKEELKNLAESLRGDQIGLILFSDFAYVQCPLTTDYKAIQMYIDLAETNQFAQTGTQFRTALGTVLERFSSVYDQNPRSSRVVVMVSDGEDFGDAYSSIIDRLEMMHTKVFTIGVGTALGGQIPDKERGGYMRFEDGTVAASTLDERDLKQISSMSKTPYFRLDSREENLDGLKEKILRLAASPLAEKIEKVNKNRYQLFLILSIVLLLTSMFLMPVRN